MSDPYLIQGPALISFSGGRTSGYMLKHILDAHGGVLPDDVHAVFANTGKERPETLDFVQECSERWNVPITWVEFDPGAEHLTKVVNHNSASRGGEPLKAAIDTRPTAHLFNMVSRYCTATTKRRRMQKFMLHWCGHQKWTAAIGIRADEPRRVESNRKISGKDRQMVALPLADAGVTNQDVLGWWRDQPFDLRLRTHDGETIGGNCDLCPMKAKWKILVAMRQEPELANWWIEQEDQMERRIVDTPQRDDGLPDRRHRFLKSGVSYRELLEFAKSNQPIKKGRGREAVDCACTD